MIVTIHAKKTWLIVGIVTLLTVIALGYALYSLQAWQSYSQDFQAWQTTTKKALVTSLALPMTSLKEREQKLAKLGAIVADLKTQEANVCRINPLTGWQTYFSGIETVQKQCHIATSKVDGLVAELGVVTTYLTNEQALATMLSTLASQPTQPDEKTWDQVAAAWHQLSVDIATAKSDASFAPTKQVAVTAASGIDAAWQELVSAHQAKDRTRFIKAQSGLVTAYDGLATITAENDKQVSALDTKLTQAYKAAF